VKIWDKYLLTRDIDFPFVNHYEPITLSENTLECMRNEFKSYGLCIVKDINEHWILQDVIWALGSERSGTNITQKPVTCVVFNHSMA